MKDIKFRAFHKIHKYMFDVTNIDFVNKTVQHNDLPFSDCELMQFTGLNDIDGKEIFEGDIIQDINDNNSLRYGKDNNLTPVEFYNESFGISVIFDGAFVPLYPYEEGGFKFKVVGNIHQNPELLEKNK